MLSADAADARALPAPVVDALLFLAVAARPLLPPPTGGRLDDTGSWLTADDLARAAASPGDDVNVAGGLLLAPSSFNLSSIDASRRGAARPLSVRAARLVDVLGRVQVRAGC